MSEQENLAALARIIARQEQHLQALRDTLASTAEVAANAEQRARARKLEADAASAEHLHREWSKSS